jgi:glutathione S-transferase
LDLLRYWRDI